MNKGLIIKKYWLDKIFHEGKEWEMRSRRTSINGKIYLIEAGSGLIVGEANLKGCSPLPIKPDNKYFDKHKIKDVELLKKWKYAWFLSDVKKYDIPISYNHPKGAVVWVNIKNMSY